jgi:hypothetical protein
LSVAGTAQYDDRQTPIHDVYGMDLRTGAAAWGPVSRDEMSPSCTWTRSTPSVLLCNSPPVGIPESAQGNPFFFNGSGSVTSLGVRVCV